MIAFTYLLCLAVLFSFTLGASIQRRNVRTREEQMEYLQRYGYLRRSEVASMSSGRMSASDSSDFSSALRRFQRMAHIPVTGQMDSATMEMMNAERCGVPDYMQDESGRRTKRYALAGTKWRSNSVRYRIHNTSPDMSPTTQINIIDYAFSIWKRVIPLSFTRSRYRFPKADINIEFTRSNHGDGYQNKFDGPGGDLAHAFFPPNGAIHFDDDEFWTAGGRGTDSQVCRLRAKVEPLVASRTLDLEFYGSRLLLVRMSGKNLLQVAVHEIGHALGLEHSEVYDSIMYPNYKRDMTRVQLHSDDIRGIQRLYSFKTRSRARSR